LSDFSFQARTPSANDPGFTNCGSKDFSFSFLAAIKKGGNYFRPLIKTDVGFLELIHRVVFA
jgi:hypothetical protein